MKLSSARAGLRVAVAGVLLALAVTGTGVPERAYAQSAFAFTDSFDDAVDADPTYGLNDALASRQRGTQRAIPYERVSGVWYPAQRPRPWYSQVNKSNRPDVLSFHVGTSAVRLDAPVVGADGGQVVAAVTTDPVVGDVSSGAWSSLVLAADRGASGYVDRADVALAALVRSDGRVQVFSRGRLVASSGQPATPDGQGRFRMEASARTGSTAATVRVGSTTLDVTLAAPLPSTTHLFLGAFLSDGAATTTFDDLAVSRLDPSAVPGAAGPRYFGYYAARLTPALGNHLSEVRGRSNLNVVSVSDYDKYVPEVLDDCAPAGCLLYTGNEFFRGCDKAGAPTCDLYPDFRERWNRLAEKVRSRMSFVAGFYLLDEPYHRGASPEEITTAARTIKETFPAAKVMLVEAAYKVDDAMVVPHEVDWVGFDWYCQPTTEVERVLRKLESRAAGGQGIFLFPQATPLRACGAKPGYGTDAELAALQWEYLRLAERHPRVVGLMSFGLWVEDTPVSRLPATIDAHERIAGQILARGRAG
jgi:hypothetical protein